MEVNNKLLRVKDLVIGPMNQEQEIVKGISFDLAEGEILGIVGESGSGKSMTVLGIMGLLKKNLIVKSGTIEYEGQDYLNLPEYKQRSLRGDEISMIFQEPMTSLNPVLKIGPQIEEVLYLHANHKKYSKEEAKAKTLAMMKEVGLKDPERLYTKYPHELSGGMRQRVMIAMAMICKPKILFADEPTTALDVTVQAQIIELIRNLCKKNKTAVIFISHDLGVIRKLCSRALIMNQGEIVEEGTIDTIFNMPKKEYTKKLLAAVPRVQEQKEDIEEIAATTEFVMEAKNINGFYKERSRFFAKKEKKQVLFDVSVSLLDGEILGIVGESGSGKTTLAKTFLGLMDQYEGLVDLHGNHPQMVFQDPYSSLNPAKKIAFLLEEPLRLRKELSKAERKKQIDDILVKVGLDESYKGRYISQLSGGQRQRVAIACAILTGSKVLLLDEPVSALDVTIQDQILKLLRNLKEEYALSYLFISHDLNVVYNFCDRVIVMKDGVVVEEGRKADIYHKPRHEYTRRLIAAMPHA